CHEAQGKLASAWAAFTTVASRSANEGRADREQLARERVDALTPRLSTLELRVPDDTAAIVGLEVRRNGVLIGRDMWNMAVPVDGAEHEVTVSAPGRHTWRSTAIVHLEHAVEVVDIPVLA